MITIKWMENISRILKVDIIMNLHLLQFKYPWKIDLMSNNCNLGDPVAALSVPR